MRDSPECRGGFSIDDFAKKLFIKKLDKVKPELRKYYIDLLLENKKLCLLENLNYFRN